MSEIDSDSECEDAEGVPTEKSVLRRFWIENNRSSVVRSRLFVIRKRGTDQFWNCSGTHGSGWNPGHPKQAFSPSELTKQIRLLIDNDWFADCDILELRIQAS